MPTFAFFLEDPTKNTVEAPDMLTAAQNAAQVYAGQANVEGTSTAPIWAVDVTAFGFGEVQIVVSTTRQVTVTPKPRPA